MTIEVKSIKESQWYLNVIKTIIFAWTFFSDSFRWSIFLSMSSVSNKNPKQKVEKCLMAFFLPFENSVQWSKHCCAIAFDVANTKLSLNYSPNGNFRNDHLRFYLRNFGRRFSWRLCVGVFRCAFSLDWTLLSFDSIGTDRSHVRSEIIRNFSLKRDNESISIFPTFFTRRCFISIKINWSALRQSWLFR